MRADLLAVNKQQLQQKEAERMRDEQEAIEIEAHASKKQSLEDRKKEREASRFANKQAERQRMIDRQIAELKALHDNAEEVLNRQVAEAEGKANRLFEEQERRKAEMKAAIERSRQLQIQRKQQEKMQAKNEEKEFAEFWRIRNDELQLAEQQEKEEDRQRAVELANFIKNQTAKKNAAHIQQF